QSLGREIFSEHTAGQIDSWQLCLPIAVVLRRVCINGLARAAVNGEIGLAVAIEIQRSRHDRSDNRFLENSRRYDLALPAFFPRQSDVDGHNLHDPSHRARSTTESC